MRSLTLYVAGPMRGYPCFNFPAFAEATAYLRFRGHKVVSPAEMDRNAFGWPRCPEANIMEGFDIPDALRRDFEAILRCDGIVLLPGWENSEGAKAERFVAETTGKAVYLYNPETPFRLSPAPTWDHRLRPDDLRATPFDDKFGYRHPPQQPRIIGLSGYAQAGKDTAAAGLLALGWERISFADVLRSFLYALNPMVRDPMWDWVSLRYVVDRRGWEAAKNGVPEVRRLLQRCGTDAGRAILGDDVWVNAAMADLRPEGSYVVTDVRFPNEAQAIKDRGGVVVRIQRPGVTAINAHPSETALDGWAFDYSLVNAGTPEQIQMALSHLSYATPARVVA